MLVHLLCFVTLFTCEGIWTLFYIQLTESEQAIERERSRILQREMEISELKGLLMKKDEELKVLMSDVNLLNEKCIQQQMVIRSFIEWRFPKDFSCNDYRYWSITLTFFRFEILSFIELALAYLLLKLHSVNSRYISFEKSSMGI